MKELFPGADLEILPFDGSALFIVEFLAETEADRLFDAVRTEVPWTTHDLVLFGKKMTEPRLSAWIGDAGISYTYSGIERHPEVWTSALEELRKRCEDAAQQRFNSVLANLYRSGEDSMGWHSDDEPELGPEPVIASISLGAERRFDFRHRTTGETVSVGLTHGSLLIMSGPTQQHWKHRIGRTKKVRSPRVNLTYRFVQHSNRKI